MEETSFVNDDSTNRGEVYDLKGIKRQKFPKNATTEYVKGIYNQTQEISNDDEDAEIAEMVLGQTENTDKVEEGIKTENKSLDAQECTGNTEQLISEVTATENNDKDVMVEKQCPVNCKVERPEIEFKSGCFLQKTQQDDGIEKQEGGNKTQQDGDGDSKDIEEATQDDRVNTNPKKIYAVSKEPNYDTSKCTFIQKANKAIRVILWWILVLLAILALVMDCGRSYFIRHISGKQMMESSTTGHMNEFPESAKGGPQSPVEVKVKEPSDLHRGQHISMSRNILGLEFYRHHAIVLNVTVLTDRKVELTSIGFSKDIPMNYSEVHGKMPVLITTDVYDLASDDLHIIQNGNLVFSPNEIAERAESEKEKSKEYDIFFNNCEHFATLAAYGFSESKQVESFFLNICRLLMCLVIFLVVIHFHSIIFTFNPSLHKAKCWLCQKNNWMKVLVFYVFYIVRISCTLTILGAELLLIYYNLKFWFLRI